MLLSFSRLLVLLSHNTGTANGPAAVNNVEEGNHVDDTHQDDDEEDDDWEKVGPKNRSSVTRGVSGVPGVGEGEMESIIKVSSDPHKFAHEESK